jgi:hypothetical protein
LLYPVFVPATPPAPAGQTPATNGLTVPPEVQQKYGDLITLIRASESMNDEERQYWVNILPVMTPDQVQNLRDILDNEKKQLAAIDQKYQTELGKLGDKEAVKQTDDERRARREKRSSTEATARKDETSAADDILKQIEGQ